MVNNFFDCLNVRSMHEHERKRNSLLAPYRNSNDPRFEWLENVFLKYLADWLVTRSVCPTSRFVRPPPPPPPHSRSLKIFNSLFPHLDQILCTTYSPARPVGRKFTPLEIFHSLDFCPGKANIQRIICNHILKILNIVFSGGRERKS